MIKLVKKHGPGGVLPGPVREWMPDWLVWYEVPVCPITVTERRA